MNPPKTLPGGEKCARPLILGFLTLALLCAQAAEAAMDRFVTGSRIVPFNSAVYIGNTTAPEWVYFSGQLGLLTRVAAPTNTCTAASPCSLPGVMVVYTPGISGVGMNSSSNYSIVGLALAPQRNFQVPGATAFQARFIVVLPRSIRPTGSLFATVSLQMVVTLNSTGGVLQAAAPPTGLASWWQAEGTAADALGFNRGTLSAGEQVGFAPGQIGQGFHFDGQGFVEVASAPSLEPTTLTVAAWVHATNTPGVDAYILSKGASACHVASYALYTGPNGGLQFYVSNGTNFIQSPDAGLSVWDGNWHFVAGTFDGAAVHLYLDGAEVGTGTPAPIVPNYQLPSNNKFYIGAYRGGCELRFNGDVDEVQVFGRALLPPEVLGLYNANR